MFLTQKMRLVLVLSAMSVAMVGCQASGEPKQLTPEEQGQIVGIGATIGGAVGGPGGAGVGAAVGGAIVAVWGGITGILAANRNRKNINRDDALYDEAYARGVAAGRGMELQRSRASAGPVPGAVQS